VPRTFFDKSPDNAARFAEGTFFTAHRLLTGTALLWGSGRMDAEQYRRRARHYLVRARQMLNPVNRVTMIDMAIIWMRMAEGAEPDNRVIRSQQLRQAQPRVPSLPDTSSRLEPVTNRSMMIRPGGWGGAVPIYRLLENEPFEPEHVTLMGNVFEDVLHTLGLIDREDPITRLVAMKVIELAQTGERDPARLKQLTLEAFEGGPN